MTVVLAERVGNRMRVQFDYDPTYVAKIKQVAGRRFAKGKDGADPHWTVPLDLTTGRQLRELFGNDLRLGPDLSDWGRKEVAQVSRLTAVATADSGDLERLPNVLPSLYRAIHLGPLGEREGVETGSYQTADVKFLAECPAPLNGNQQGLGKTLELIGSVWEAGLERGCHLVIAPLAAIDATWPKELLRWQQDAAEEVGVWSCLGNRSQKSKAISEFLRSDKPVKWLLINPQMVQLRKTDDQSEPIVRRAANKDFTKACHCDRSSEAHWHYAPAFPELFGLDWTTITIDECHKGSIRNHRSLTSFSIHKLALAEGGKKIAMSGTPMKKQGADLWGILHWLRPDVWTSYWSFAERFFTVTSNGYGNSVGGLRDDMEDEFFRAISPYVLRRTKSECLPWLPPKQYVDVEVTMSGKQQKQYLQMQAEGAAIISDSEISATSILAEMTRLRQFSNAYSELSSDGKVVPTRESAKIDAMIEKMDETGIFDEGSEQQTIVFSQFRKMAELVAEVIAEKGVSVEIISGKTGRSGERGEIVERFQSGETKVLCVVTTAGGVSLTLDAADSAHFIDESFAPDDDEQAEDRIHRASRNHNVTIYRYRSKNSIDQMIAETASEKKSAHERILDIRREIMKSSLK